MMMNIIIYIKIITYNVKLRVQNKFKIKIKQKIFNKNSYLNQSYSVIIS